MEQRMSLITLGYRDFRRARDFYTALGWTIGWTDDDVIFFEARGMIVALWDREKLAKDSCVQDSGGWGGATLGYNTGSPEEVDEVLAQAEAAGATGSSSTPKATRGRSRTTPTGRCTRTAASP
jgi:catechol 2,3-dioxygenase-like lactoylglutathione lyase family enzyme